MDYSLFRIDEEEWSYLKAKLKDAENRWGMPLYLFSEAKARQNVETLKHFMGGRVQIAYAMKANPWLTEIMASSADFLEVCSEGELEICRDNKVSGEKIVVDGVYQNDNFINKALEMNVKRISVDSPEQLKRIMRLSEEKKKPEILLRVNSGNQFGMEEKEIIECIHICREYQWTSETTTITGIQYYPGTQRNNIRQIEKEIRKLQQWLDFFEKQEEMKIKTVQFGSGVGAPYFEEDDVKDYAEALEYVLNYAEKLSQKYTVTYECGRNIAASAGIYVTKVFGKKQKKGKGVLFCLGGTNHLTYHGGILGIRIPHAESICNSPHYRKGRFMVCGPLCSEGDVLIRDCKLLDENTNKGDYIAFFNAGAYCPIESANLFLSMEMPAVLLYNRNDNFFQEIRGHFSTYKLIRDRM